MFTGLIEQIGTLKTIEKINGGTRLTIAHDSWKEPLRDGESIAVNGICFTITGSTMTSFTCDALDETIARTSLSLKRAGAPLNLERALRFGDRLGGHLVSGHVDGTAGLCSVRDAGRDKVMRFRCSSDLLKGMVLKGSVACDGVSLTISALTNDCFEVNLVPFSWANTTLARLVEGDVVNIETDMLGKYVLSRSSETAGISSRLSLDHLRKAGFAD